MKRYHYSPGVPAAGGARARRWLIPAGLVAAVGGVIALATLGRADPVRRAPPAAAPAIRIAAADPDAGRAARAGDAGAPFTAGERYSRTFGHCGMVRRETCVVDGDTFWLDGVKIRVADIDTPEVSQPQCAAEKALGDRATERFLALLNAGPFELATIGSRDADRHGRKLRVVLRGGRSLGDQLVAEGLARTWTGRREPWCEPAPA